MTNATTNIMRLSQLFTKTRREAPKDAKAINHILLVRGGFIRQNSSGIYTFLPLGWRVIQKIAGIIREEINRIGGQEMFMPALIEKKYMETTGRWNVPIGYRVQGLESGGTGEEDNFVLGWSHEDLLTNIALDFVSSWEDLPFAAYQIQTKFRNEPRAKSGLLRGREFMMKDLYSFHTDEKDLERYYEEVKGAYHKIFHRCGLKAIYTLAAGGVFTAENTHEFQIVADVGEDTIFVCRDCEYAENKEITKLKDGDHCPKCDSKVIERKSIEVGNIFPLGTKYSEAIGLKFVDDSGESHFVTMGSYGIGLSRLMGTLVEVHHDEKGIIWPEAVAPFKAHLVMLTGAEKASEELYEKLLHSGVDVLYDDRTDKTAGEKFADADLIGCPIRLLVSEKTLQKNSIDPERGREGSQRASASFGVEVKRRNEKDVKLVSIDNLISNLL